MKTSESESTINGSDRRLYTSKNVISLIARILLSALFLLSAVNKIMNPAGTQQYMTANGMPLVGLLYIAAVVIEVGGGLSVLLGYKARWGAIALAIFLIPATLIFHTNFANQIQQIMFMKNLAIFGGLLMIIQYGAGRISLDKH
ncbi:DoxX family protein [Synechocystis sp. PCC 7509]|uniref:DoxX family protein n=1 Tax=Synechocystis sp. PCC 7509 TaxID=927677 RepID=UPI0003011C0A|nr:DoxX family protein [Synechocystis sp. PCC 7509]